MIKNCIIVSPTSQSAKAHIGGADDVPEIGTLLVRPGMLSELLCRFHSTADNDPATARLVEEINKSLDSLAERAYRHDPENSNDVAVLKKRVEEWIGKALEPEQEFIFGDDGEIHELIEMANRIETRIAVREKQHRAKVTDSKTEGGGPHKGGSTARPKIDVTPGALRSIASQIRQLPSMLKPGRTDSWINVGILGGRLLIEAIEAGVFNNHKWLTFLHFVEAARNGELTHQLGRKPGGRNPDGSLSPPPEWHAFVNGFGAAKRLRGEGGERPFNDALLREACELFAEMIEAEIDAGDNVTAESPASHVTPQTKNDRAQETAVSLPKADLPPSRVKARAAYEWAIERIEDAGRMPLRDLLPKIKEQLRSTIDDSSECDGERLESLLNDLPDNAETFGKYLREAGIKKYNRQGERIRRISHFKGHDHV